jgi:O-antigen/teichoic acid export membrane protein
MEKLKVTARNLLRKSERIFKTDMVYLARGGFWLGIGQVFSSLSAFILSIAFANFLSPDEYGIYRYILSTAALLTIPALGGIDTALTQAVSRGYDGSFYISRKVKFRYGLLGSAGSILFGIYYLYNGNSVLGSSFLVTGIFLPFMESLSLYDSLLQGRKNFKLSSVFSSFGQLTSVSVTLMMLLFTKSIPVLVFAYFFSWTIARYTSLRLTIKEFEPSGSVDEGVISYGKHLSVMGILGTIANYIDRFLVFHFVGAAELAVYSIAIAPPEQIKAFLKNIQSLALPKYSERSFNSIQTSLRPKLLQISMLIMAVVIAYIIAAPFVYQIFFPKYLSAVVYSQIFSVSLITIGASLVVAAMQAHRTQEALYKFNIWTSIIQISLVVAGVTTFGLMGIILARVISRFFVLFYSIYVFRSAETT